MNMARSNRRCDQNHNHVLKMERNGASGVMRMLIAKHYMPLLLKGVRALLMGKK